MSLLKKTNKQERLFASVHPKFAPKVGGIGMLSDVIKNKDEIKTKKWEYFNSSLNTPEFMEDFKKNIMPFFQDGRLLNNTDTMQQITKQYYDDLFTRLNNADYVYRLDSDIYSYFIKCLPYRGIFYIYAYLKQPVEEHMEKAKAGVLFVNIQNEPIFNVPDGDQIMIIYDKSTKQPRTVRYIDEKHIQVGGYIYTPFEFADCMDDIEATIIPLRSSLPKFCYSYIESKKRVMLIKKGDNKYFPCGDKMDLLTGKMEAKTLNDKYGITSEQEKAMVAGIENGWDDVTADPDYYIQKEAG